MLPLVIYLDFSKYFDLFYFKEKYLEKILN